MENGYLLMMEPEPGRPKTLRFHRRLLPGFLLRSRSLPASPAMGRKHAGDGEEVAGPGELEVTEAPHRSGSLENLGKRKKKRDKKGGEEAIPEEERAPESNGRSHDENGRSKKTKKKKTEGEKTGEGEIGGVDDGGARSGKKRKKLDGGNDVDKATEQGIGVREEAVGAKCVSVSGKNSTDSKYAALKSFSDSGLPANVLECCKNFSKPSPIQSNAWPFLLDGRDFVGIAATGSGEAYVPQRPSCVFLHSHSLFFLHYFSLHIVSVKRIAVRCS